MADTVLKSIYLRNWMTVREASVDFPASGVVAIHGLNTAAGDKIRSVGSGKSAIGEAISRSLLGVPGRYALLGRYCTEDADNTYVKLTCLHKGKPLVIEMGFKAPEINKSSEGFRFTYDDQQVWRDNLRHTRDDLASLLTVPADLAAWTVHFDGDRLKFNDLSQKTSVDLLMASLNQAPWTEFQRNAQVACAQLKQDVAVSRSACDSARTLSEETDRDLALILQRVESTKVDLVRLTEENAARLRQAELAREKDVRALTDIQTGMRGLKSKIDEAVSVNEKEEHELEIRRNSLNDKLQIIVDARDAAREESGERATAIRDRQSSAQQVFVKEKAAVSVRIAASEKSRQTAHDVTVRTIRQKRDDAKSIESDLVGRLNAVKAEIRKIETAPKSCPTCGKDWDTCADSSPLPSLRQAAADTAQKVNAAKLSTGAVDADILDVQSKFDAAAAAADEADARVFDEIQARAEASLASFSAELDVEAKRLSSVMSGIELEIAAARGAMTKASEALVSLRAKSPVQQFSRQYEELELAESAANRRLETLERQIENLQRGPDRSELDRVTALAYERKRVRDRQQVKLQNEAAALVENEEALKITNYWQRAFGPSGIPNMILRDAVEPLNAASKRVSVFLAGSALQITYSMSKKLVSGDDKAELSVSVRNDTGSARLEGSSKGEASLSNLIVAETLAEVGQVANRIGYRFYDEIAVNQEAMVRTAISAWLRDVSRRYGILTFVVSHSAEAANFADHKLLAEKNEKGTVYRWE